MNWLSKYFLFIIILIPIIVFSGLFYIVFFLNNNNFLLNIAIFLITIVLISIVFGLIPIFYALHIWKGQYNYYWINNKNNPLLKNCLNCGNTIYFKASFCPKCGKKIKND